MNPLPNPPDDPPPSGFGESEIDLLALGKALWKSGAGPTSAWEPPTVEALQMMLPGYQIEKFIARGGMGAVYRGVQAALGRVVAIKILPPGLQDQDISYAERFKQEARAMAQLDHPSIVPVYAFGEMADGTLYFVMEFIEGTDVAEMVASQGRLSSMHAMAIAAHVCDALRYAHDHGIVHRDIKPANIMVGFDGRVKVADFGLAKVAQGGGSGLTQSGFVMGTECFLAPEALVQGAVVDHRADIYAVGVMLYQMLTGRLPKGLFELPSLQIPGLDPRYDVIVRDAMRELPEQRYQHIKEMRRALDGILTQPVKPVRTLEAETVAVRKDLPLALMKRPAPQPRVKAKTTGRKRSVLLGLLLVMAAMLGTAAWMWTRYQAADVSKPASQIKNAVSSTPAPAEAKTAAASNPDVLSFGGHRYQFVPENVSWEEARARAVKMGGHLATITSQEEDAWISATFVPRIAGKWANCKLGGIRQGKGRPWQWITGEPFTYTHWWPGEPNAPDATAYLNLWRRRQESEVVQWDDSPLSKDPYNRGFLVEWDDDGKNPAAPSVSYTNILGMKFVPVPGTNALFCIHETRVSDFAAFVSDTGYEDSKGGWAWELQASGWKQGAGVSWRAPGFAQTGAHPVTCVNETDASAFCQWLSRKEGRTYRLPKDREWSIAAGIDAQEDRLSEPAVLDGQVHDVYPWGSGYPPKSIVANLSGEETRSSGPGRMGWIHSYNDGYSATAPVMSFPPNSLGLYDMAGNVWELCDDWLDGKHDQKLMRGGAWTSGDEKSLRSSTRGPIGRGQGRRFSDRGFRCVIDLGPPAASTSSSPKTASVAAK